ncbi:MAG: hypothetical protein QME77_12245, partial [bacterium]|nr:hypothetical protein [bacterium]
MHELNRQLRAEHAAAEKERQHILGTSPPLEELLAAMEERVDAAAASWMREHGVQLPHTLGPGLEIKSDGSIVSQRSRFPYALENRPLDFNALCALAPDLVKQQLRRILSAIPYKAGPPLADRTRLLVEADARIAEIERAHEELCDSAAALEPPVTLTLLLEVKARREAEQAKADRERVQREARERAQRDNPAVYRERLALWQ